MNDREVCCCWVPLSVVWRSCTAAAESSGYWLQANKSREPAPLCVHRSLQARARFCCNPCGRLYYLALPPSVYPQVCAGLKVGAVTH